MHQGGKANEWKRGGERKGALLPIVRVGTHDTAPPLPGLQGGGQWGAMALYGIIILFVGEKLVGTL